MGVASGPGRGLGVMVGTVGVSPGRGLGWGSGWGSPVGDGDGAGCVTVGCAVNVEIANGWGSIPGIGVVSVDGVMRGWMKGDGGARGEVAGSPGRASGSVSERSSRGGVGVMMGDGWGEACGAACGDG